ncbi:MAG: YbjN domain-containing protein [Bacteroidales bacterium]
MSEEKLISNENVSKELVKEIFDNAFLDTGYDQDDLFIKETWRTWLFVDEKNRFLSFNLYFNLNQNSKLADRLDYVNYVSKEFIIVKVALYDKTVRFGSYIWLEGGVSPRNIIKAYKAFIMVIEEALNADKNGVLA